MDRVEDERKKCLMPGCTNAVESGRLCDACKGFGRRSGWAEEKSQQTGGDEMKETRAEISEGRIGGERDGSPAQDEGTKRCTKCGPVKGPLPLSKFAKDKTRKDGRKVICRECQGEYMKGYHARQKAEREALRGKRQAAKNERQAATVERSAEAISMPQPPAPVRDREQQGPAGSGIDPVMRIDFSGYPEVLEDIKNYARDQDRTPEAQVRYLMRAFFGLVPESEWARCS